MFHASNILTIMQLSIEENKQKTEGNKHNDVS